MKLIKFSYCALISLTFAVSNSLEADTFQYGDFNGDAVSYLGVTESSLSEGPLFGGPEVEGDLLDFPATGFVTASQDGGSELLDGRLSLIVASNGSEAFNSISIEEFGSFLTFGSDSLAFVNMVAFVETADGVFSNEFQFTAGGSNDPNAGGWFESATISFPSTTYAELTIDNQLLTSAGIAGTSFIDKKGVNISVGIPEPSVFGVLTLASFSLCIRRRL